MKADLDRLGRYTMDILLRAQGVFFILKLGYIS